MGELITAMQVVPDHHQVIVRGEDATDLPIPETGLERAIASTEAILIATHEERLGEVHIEVRRGWPEHPWGTTVFEGEISLTTPRLVVGSDLAGYVVTVDVGRIGWLPISIRVDPPDAPDRILVAIDTPPAQD